MTTISEKTSYPLNSAMVTLARESRGKTQTELARLLQISQALLSRIETGLFDPSQEIVTKLSLVLNYPEAFFYQTDQIYGPGLSEFYHRRRQDVPAHVLNRVHAEINIIRMHVSRLIKAVELPPLKIKPLELDEFRGKPEEIARAIRHNWQLPQGPVHNVVKTIEDAGGIVFRYSFGTSKIDAISRWVPGLPPLFFVNESLTTDRERLSLCHELGHIIMHDALTSDMEIEANRFAAEFLMPEREIKPQLGGLNLSRLAAIKPYWRVSMAAALYRAVELNQLSERQARYLWSQMSSLGYKRREPMELDLSPEVPSLFQEILDMYTQSFGYGLEDLQKMLAASDADLMRIYKLQQSSTENKIRLRVVK